MHSLFLRAPWAPMALFVLLWGSAAIFIRVGLDHSSPLALLVMRFAMALLALLVLTTSCRRFWPAQRHRGLLALAGLLMLGPYSICYFQDLSPDFTL